MLERPFRLQPPERRELACGRLELPRLTLRRARDLRLGLHVPAEAEERLGAGGRVPPGAGRRKLLDDPRSDLRRPRPTFLRLDACRGEQVVGERGVNQRVRVGAEPCLTAALVEPGGTLEILELAEVFPAALEDPAGDPQHLGVRLAAEIELLRKDPERLVMAGGDFRLRVAAREECLLAAKLGLERAARRQRIQQRVRATITQACEDGARERELAAVLERAPDCVDGGER